MEQKKKYMLLGVIGALLLLIGDSRFMMQVLEMET